MTTYFGIGIDSPSGDSLVFDCRIPQLEAHRRCV
jgi:hypothetical protein